MVSGEVVEAPRNLAAEWSVLGHLLTDPACIPEVIGVPLEQIDFTQPDTRLLYATTVERYYRNEPVDALIVGELAREQLANYWQADPTHCSDLLIKRVREAGATGQVIEHAAIVKRLSTNRQLMDKCYHAIAKIQEGRLSPEEIGDALSTDALGVTSGTMRRSELLDWMDTGRQYVTQLQRVIKARQQGREIGVYTSLACIDNFTAGIGPGELCFLAGEPGVGKTAVAWGAAMGFATRQLVKDEDKRVGTLMLSMEMNLYGSTARIVSSLTGIDGVKLREGRIGQDEYRQILQEWKGRERLPVVFNFASNFRLSQMRALIAEAIRRHHVGFVVIDHFRMLDTDRRYQNPNDADEAKVRFLKENVCKDLNVAVMCLAHSTKVGRGQGGESPRPRLSDLRGSGMIAAHADFVGFLWSSYKHMSEEARSEFFADPDEMELSWEKNRWGTPGTARLKFEADTMKVLSR